MSSERHTRIDALGYDYASKRKARKETCNLCHGRRFVTITHRDRYGFPAPASTCVHCGLTSLAQPMTPEAYTHFYMEVYRPLVSAFHGRLIDAQSIQGEQWDYAREVIEIVRPFWWPEFGTLLDIGGSTGVVSVAMKEAFGVRPTVIDPAPAETAEAEAQGIESITGFVEEWDAGERTFDSIAIFQTVDHLLNVGATLAKARRLLTPHGLLIVDIVDFEAAMRRNRSVEAAIKIDHVYSFTQDTFEAMLSRHGFRWLHKSYAPDHLHVLYLCTSVPPDTEACPSAQWIHGHLDEIRRIQNTP